MWSFQHLVLLEEEVEDPFRDVLLRHDYDSEVPALPMVLAMSYAHSALAVLVVSTQKCSNYQSSQRELRALRELVLVVVVVFKVVTS